MECQLEHPRTHYSQEDALGSGRGTAPIMSGRGHEARQRGPYTRQAALTQGPPEGSGRHSGPQAHDRHPALLLAHHDHPQLPEGCFSVQLDGGLLMPCPWRADGSMPAWMSCAVEFRLAFEFFMAQNEACPVVALTEAGLPDMCAATVASSRGVLS